MPLNVVLFTKAYCTGRPDFTTNRKYNGEILMSSISNNDHLSEIDKLSSKGHSINGACSTAAGIFITQPVWTWKTLDQSSGKSPVYRLKAEYLENIAKGISPLKAKAFIVNRLWAGYVPNAGSGAFAEGINFATYFIGKKILKEENGNLTKVNNLGLSFFSAFFGSPFNAGIERGMILQQIDPKTKFFDQIKKIIAIEGKAGLLKGTGSTFGRDGFFNCGVFAFNDIAKELLSPFISEPLMRDIFAGMFSGGLAGALSTPLDLIKTRMQEDLKNEYPTFRKTIKKINLEEGIKGLFNGVKSRTLACGGLICITTLLKDRIPQYLPDCLRSK